MRREKFELSISPPVVLYKTGEDGKRLEPIEEVTAEAWPGPPYAIFIFIFQLFGFGPLPFSAA